MASSIAWARYVLAGSATALFGIYGAGWQTDVCMYNIYNVSWGVTPKPIAWTGTYRVALSCSCQCAVGPNKRPEVLGDPFFWKINKYHPPSTNQTDQTMKMVVLGFYSPCNENWYIRWSCSPLLGSIIADYTPKDWAVCEKNSENYETTSIAQIVVEKWSHVVTHLKFHGWTACIMSAWSHAMSLGYARTLESPEFHSSGRMVWKRCSWRLADRNLVCIQDRQY